ncbi:MAG: DUF3572 domain-containing protein [Marinibacterium sp.]
MPMAREAAETFALDALGWLAGNQELLPVFMGASGAGLDDLRARAGDPEFLASVLDFLLMDDAWILSVCSDLGVSPEIPRAARAALPGGAQVHWT